jgi:hypothetical protein
MSGAWQSMDREPELFRLNLCRACDRRCPTVHKQQRECSSVMPKSTPLANGRGAFLLVAAFQGVPTACDSCEGNGVLAGVVGELAASALVVAGSDTFSPIVGVYARVSQLLSGSSARGNVVNSIALFVKIAPIGRRFPDMTVVARNSDQMWTTGGTKGESRAFSGKPLRAARSTEGRQCVSGARPAPRHW